jgi:methylated-DNA-protein-cysteine methyltransferase related protein
MKKVEKKKSRHEKIYEMVKKIPRGKVATYGQIASLVERCTPRMAGWAMAAVPLGSDVPWHRVINSLGRISPRKNGDGDMIQRVLLEAENIVFDHRRCVDLKKFGWSGPVHYDPFLDSQEKPPSPDTIDAEKQ